MVSMEAEGYLSGSQVEKHIESFGITKPSPRFIALFFVKSPESVPSVSCWYKPKGDLTIPQIKKIIEKGKLAKKSKETYKAILNKDKVKQEEIWQEVSDFVLEEIQNVPV